MSLRLLAQKRSTVKISEQGAAPNAGGLRQFPITTPPAARVVELGDVRYPRITMKRKIRALIVCWALLLGVAFFISSEAVSPSRFAQVTDGMSEVQVRELLGVPHHVRRGAPDEMGLVFKN